MIAVIGGTGQLGRELMKVFAKKAIAIPHAHGGDLLDPINLRAVLAHVSPSVVINAAAENRVDWCQDHPDAALALNTTGIANLARICKHLDVPLIHFSTDYVFDGSARTPIGIATTPNPINHYGRSKYLGEVMARMLHSRLTVIRTSALYAKGGSRSKGTNFVDFVVSSARKNESLRIVKDQTVSPTYALDLADVVRSELPRLVEEPGTYHAVNNGACTWAGFADAIMEISGRRSQIVGVTSDERPSSAPRPTYSALLSSFVLPDWKDALRAYLS